MSAEIIVHWLVITGWAKAIIKGAWKATLPLCFESAELGGRIIGYIQA